MPAEESAPQRAVVLFAHGARDPEWARPFEALRRNVLALTPGVAAEIAYLEMMRTTLAEAVSGLAARGIGRITIVPIFFAQGGHLKRDLPAIVDALRLAHPALDIEVTPAIGEQPQVIAAIAACVSQLARS